VCISFHSLEDRIVKHFLQEHKTEFDILTPRVIIGSEDEIKNNPSSRSAKLRAARKK
jgi:16S rRNA (cytosine1402-N4)-methyltransferase